MDPFVTAMNRIADSIREMHVDMECMCVVLREFAVFHDEIRRLVDELTPLRYGVYWLLTTCRVDTITALVWIRDYMPEML